MYLKLVLTAGAILLGSTACMTYPIGKTDTTWPDTSRNTPTTPELDTTLNLDRDTATDDTFGDNDTSPYNTEIPPLDTTLNLDRDTALDDTSGTHDSAPLDTGSPPRTEEYGP